MGLARIGVATCDPLELAARPVTVIHRKSRREDFDRLANWVRVESAEAVVCGLPLNMDGSEGERAKSTRKWAMKLAHALRAILGYPVPILFWDERLSTFAAQEIIRGGKIKEKIGEDAAAAAVILQSYLDKKRVGELHDLDRIDLPPKEPPATGSPAKESSMEVATGST